MGGRTSVPVLGQGSAAPLETRENAEVHPDSAPERWRFEGFTLDLASRTLSDVSGKEVPLWRSEFALLAAFLRAPGRALSREPSVTMMLRQATPGSLPLRAEVNASDGYAHYRLR